MPDALRTPSMSGDAATFLMQGDPHLPFGLA